MQNLSTKTWKCQKIWFLVIFETFTPVSLFWTNNNTLLDQTMSISSKPMFFPTSSANIGILPRLALYLWRHKIGKNRIFFGKYEILLNFNVDFKGEGVRKSKKVKPLFFMALWSDFHFPQFVFSYLLRTARYLNFNFWGIYSIFRNF